MIPNYLIKISNAILVNDKTKTIFILLKYDLFKKRSFSWYFTSSGYDVKYHEKLRFLHKSYFNKIYIVLVLSITQLFI